MVKRILNTLLLLLLSFSVIISCSKKTEPTKGPVIVASKIDTEGALLGKMIKIVLAENGFKVVDKTEFGPTDVIRKAIIHNEIDLYPEYTGNGAFFYDDAKSNVWKNVKKGYARIKKLDMKKHSIAWLTPAPANNTWAIAVRKDLADKENLKTMDDFAKYIRGGGNIKMACSEEFASRKDTLPSFQKIYNFKLKREQLLILSGGNTAQTEKAAAEKTNGVNTAMAYGTDGGLAALKLVVLKDTKEVQPVYAPTPIVRKAILVKYPEIEVILNKVFKSLDMETLQRLNSEIAIAGKNAEAVAKNYLQSKGFIK